jgi:hypothetical protein
MAMNEKEFEKELDGLSQQDILTATVSVLNTLLVKKGLITVEELQDGFREWKAGNEQVVVRFPDSETVDRFIKLDRDNFLSTDGLTFFVPRKLLRILMENNLPFKEFPAAHFRP